VERPASTYRLQLAPGFGFVEAAAVVPYLAALGITDLYLSPPFAAAPGSAHGYDVVDHNTLRDELGGEAGWQTLARAARAHGLGVLLDFVPNHMGIGPTNAWWMDVLENGPSSVYAPFFDVDWRPVKLELENKVLVPVLGDQFGAVLERGELRLERDDGAFHIAYHEHRFPVAPRAVPLILLHRSEELRAQLGEGDVQLQELLSIVTALEKLAPRSEVDPEKVAERAREKEVAKRRLAALVEASPRIRQFLDDNVQIFNGRIGDPRSFDRLAALLDAQAYRLADWRVAGEEINYRRFFDVNALAAIRIEDERVFTETHRLVFRLIEDGQVTGLRIDHPDGLYAPTAYFRRLQERFGGREGERPLYVVVEKILEGPERMPAPWAVDGTTGYDFLAAVGGLFVDGAHGAAFDALYTRFTGAPVRFDELVYWTKKRLLGSAMASELRLLGHRLNRISEGHRRTRDFTLRALERVIVEYIACLPIYRTYVDGGAVDARDRQYIESALERAQRYASDLSPSIFRFFRDILLLRAPPELDAAHGERLEFVRKLQQVTGSVAAKAVEDTVFYVYNRLISLNEVGGDPSQFGCSVEAFHALNRDRLVRWPGSLNATSTHDTKRSEDVRLRVSALSEIPDEWERRIRLWAELNRAHKTRVDGAEAPDANDELLIYQTLVGAFPVEAPDAEFAARLLAYLEKALKEAKVHTSWVNPNDAYDEATKRFVTALLAPGPFLDDFLPFQRRVAEAAYLSSLSQVALKIAAPGVADFYQGCELWSLSLVDPDNRRPVDFARRAALLDELRRRLVDGPAARARLAAEVAAPGVLGDGQAKLLLTAEALALRRADRELFRAGEYVPLTVEGAHAAHVVALLRRRGARQVAVVAPRLCLTLLDAHGGRIAWRGRVRLPGDWREVVSGRRLSAVDGALSLAECFAGFPVALLSCCDAK
jgi:(1->4)-alpha-D-glucan 1-alpha-D-glucosylmutase